MIDTISSLLSEIGVTENVTLVSKDLVEKYTGLERHYHDIEHVYDGMKELPHIKDRIQDYPSFVIAWLFHDSIYVPGFSDNERASACYAKLMCHQLKLSEDKIRVIQDLILVTDHRDYPTLTDDQKHLRDLDLKVFGLSEEEVDTYDRLIAAENCIVPLRTYVTKRTVILTYFLNRNPLYETEYFRDHYETTAKNNLKRLIQKLSIRL